MHHLQIDVNMVQAARSVAAQLGHSALRDPSLVLKTVISEALGGPVLRPWRVHCHRGPITTVLGHSDLAAEAVRQRLGFALPAIREAIVEVYGYEAPGLNTGQQLRFRVRMVPTIRVTPGQGRRHGERDAYLAAVDKGDTRTRAEVYVDYLNDRLEGAQVDSIHVDSFRLEKLVRKAGDGYATKTFPITELVGSLTITDPQSFQQVLTKGIGRQRGFGFGMLRLEAPRAAQAA